MDINAERIVRISFKVSMENIFQKIKKLTKGNSEKRKGTVFSEETWRKNTEVKVLN